MQTDHLGNQYKNVEEMCAAHIVKEKSTYKSRLNRGWSKEKALTTPVDKEKVVERKGREVADHSGQIFPCKKNMCEHYGISVATFDQRCKSGWTIKDALTIPVTQGNANSIKCVDHLGNEYANIGEMCKAYNVLPQTYTKRINKGYSIEYALTKESRRGCPQECTDHLGNTFASMKEMCEFWGVDPDAYSQRIIAQKMSVEEALTKPMGKGSGKKCVDHLGNEYPSLKDMADAYKISPGTLSRRIKVQHMSIKDALLTPVIETENWTENIGKAYDQRVGLKCTVINTNAKRGVVTVRFEDGTEVQTEASLVKEGAVAHPKLRYGRIGDFCGFVVKLAWKSDDATYYTAVCKNCGIKEIMTPYEMMKHQC